MKDKRKKEPKNKRNRGNEAKEKLKENTSSIVGTEERTNLQSR